MKNKCIICGEEIVDNYNKVTGTNARVYCDKCVERKWKARNRALTKQIYKPTNY